MLFHRSICVSNWISYRYGSGCSSPRTLRSLSMYVKQRLLGESDEKLDVSTGKLGMGSQPPQLHQPSEERAKRSAKNTHTKVWVDFNPIVEERR
eukprot:1243166-Amphidinium_carterae.1